VDKHFATPAITSAKYVYVTNNIWFDYFENRLLLYSYRVMIVKGLIIENIVEGVTEVSEIWKYLKIESDQI
jgi:hypothetical protein